MLIKTFFIYLKLRSISYKIFNKIENNGNIDFDKDGEY